VKFTVLGASGFIGSHLVSALRRANHEVYAPSRSEAQIFEAALGHLIYCVGLTADFRSRPFDTVRAHVTLLAEVLERAHFDSLLYLSSTRVYAGSAAADEGQRISVDVSDPSDLYNVSKLAGEALCRSCGRSGVKVARLSNVVGYKPGSSDFLSSLIREACSGRIELRSNPASSKDYILLEDVVTLLPKIASEGKSWLYNVAAGHNVTHDEIVRRLVDLTGCELVVEPRAPRLEFPCIDTARIRSEFDFQPGMVLNVLPQLVAGARE
jgi:nucleoside-diphosphate-sugar epimerase